ncbi:hypothetical protein IAU59_001501 [Kwoniella sp. CBS 9459]
MEDILPTLIIIGAVYLLVKWLSGSKSGNNAGETGVIRGVTPAMVETVHSAFPDIPLPNIIYHLSRSRSAQTTSEVILERGFLSAPPPDFNIPVSLLPSTATAPIANPAAGGTTNTTTTSSSTNSKNASTPVKASSLIDRYNLSSRLSASNASPSLSPSPVPSLKGKEVDPIEKNGDGFATGSGVGIGAGAETPSSIQEGGSERPSTPGTPQSTASGTSASASPGNWETTREKRELGLKERKERMILEARRRLLERQAKEAAAS